MQGLPNGCCDIAGLSAATMLPAVQPMLARLPIRDPEVD